MEQVSEPEVYNPVPPDPVRPSKAHTQSNHIDRIYSDNHVLLIYVFNLSSSGLNSPSNSILIFLFLEGGVDDHFRVEGFVNGALVCDLK